MKGSLYTLSYAGVLGAVCALLLTAAASFTAPYKKANADAERNRNILNVLQVPYSAEVSAHDLVKIFETNVGLEDLGELKFYRYPKDSNKAETVAVAFEGAGLWGPIKGFLALGQDMKTIRGITFYEQEETPGLGGEIAAKWFRDQFADKSIEDKDGSPGFIISSSGDPAPNKVDGISGATMTCDKVQMILNELIKKISKEKE